MVARKQTKLGYDPLAWMQEDEADAEEVKPAKPAPRARKPAAKKNDHPLGLDVETLETSFALLEPKLEEVVDSFYDELFASYPEVRPLFANTSKAKQIRKLSAALRLVAGNLKNVDSLAKALTAMGARHQGYGVEAEHYEMVANSLLKVMKAAAGRAWTRNVNKAWTDALNVVAEVMLSAYDETVEEESEMAANTAESGPLSDDEREELIRMRAAVNSTLTATMMINRDFEIIFVNEATVKMLEPHQDTLKRVFPGFDIYNLVGANIDQFHKDPRVQRKLLSDPDNLPYTTDIEVGELKFQLNVTAIVDEDGEYTGNTLEWHNVTEQRAREIEITRLKSAIDGASTNLMMCDENLRITYANPAVINMLLRRQDALRKIWPSLDANNLVGTCIDDFHKDPSHQRALLSDPSRLPFRSTNQIGELEFDLSATYVSGPDGEYMGNLVEWKDITDQRDAERQINEMIQDAIEGKLDRRIDYENYEGFMHSLGKSINQLMDAIVEPIQEGKRALAALADGDLTQIMQGEFKGDFAELRDAINSSITNLLNMVGQILNASGSISSGASEIARGNQDLSQRTEEQASSLEETASSMEQMTSTVRQNADNARQANQLATAAREQASKGGEVVKNAVDAMAEINQSSNKIADIIGVIDEIAFQTNLLALNAAVEAARAGEQGRGFAVVAGEVRNLAQRSAGAAKEIKALINDSVDKVEEGSKLVDESGKTLEEIVEAVKKVSDIIAEIAAASQEQSAGIEEVNKAISQMDEMTQQNAALVEEAAAASESMEEQSRQMIELMGYFKTGEEQAGQPAVSSSQPAPQPRQQAAPVRELPTRKPAPRVEEDDEWEDF